MLIPVNALATTTNSLVSNAIGAGGIEHVMPLINKIGRFSFLIMLGLVIVTALFPQALLSVYTNEAALISESVPSCFTIEILYYTLLLATSYIYFKKAKWQNKKI